MDNILESVYNFIWNPLTVDEKYTWNNILYEGDAGEREKQNINAETYTFDNYFNHKNPMNVATSQVGVVPTGYQFDIDSSNRLLREGDVRRIRTGCKHINKPYITCPYLGRGRGNIDIENAIVYSTPQAESRCDIQSSERSYLPFTQMPLINEAQKLVGKNALLYNYDNIGIDTRMMKN
jgi:hypothetical protein